MQRDVIKSLKAVEQAKIAQMDQPVFVSELFVRFPKEDSFGEDDNDKIHPDPRNRVTRLSEHIQIWSKIADRYHKNRYFKKYEFTITPTTAEILETKQAASTKSLETENPSIELSINLEKLGYDYRVIDHEGVKIGFISWSELTEKYDYAPPAIEQETLYAEKDILFPKILALISEHGHAHVDGMVRSDAVDKITRLSSNEFALYTKDRPLSQDEFSELVQNIENSTKDLPLNVHLALGTVAVSIQDGPRKLHLNIALYVQGGGGAHPKLHITPKSNPFEFDRDYEGYKLYGRVLKNVLTKPRGTEKEPVEGLKTNPNPENPNPRQVLIDYNPVFIVDTEGGAKVFIGMDICADYDIGNATIAFDKQIKDTLKNSDNSTYFPHQRSHLILANTGDMPLKKGKAISHRVAYANPDAKGGSLSSPSNQEEKPYVFDVNEDKNYSDIVPSFQSTTISVTPASIKVINPPFGSNYEIAAYQEHALTFDTDPTLHQFKELIDQVNASVMKRRIDATLTSNNFVSTQADLEKVKTFWHENKDKLLINSSIKRAMKYSIKIVCDPEQSTQVRYDSVNALAIFVNNLKLKQSSSPTHIPRDILVSASDLNKLAITLEQIKNKLKSELTLGATTTHTPKPES